ncbi:MAG TPA: aminomethyl-transferring glycine dehydrogenase subunit GcvPB [Phycisphaerae bacterium]|nr:aminomethyl-transferring glycine dehydrogenase subunit GcvPB [Phycisphaerae bacterium]
MASGNDMTTHHQNEAPLLFEKSTPGTCAASLPRSDVPAVDRNAVIGADLLADAPPQLPEIGELDLVRHYTRLSHRCFSIDEHFYPLGSCTMKYNPRINERAAAMPGFAQVHPYQDESDVQGLLELLYRLRMDLAEVSGLAEVTLQPAAGAHGEMTGLMIINAYHRDRGQPRTKVLAPDSAHGTNPASCTICGKSYQQIASLKSGRIDVDALRQAVDDDTAALMITNPNTVGVYDEQIADIAEILHARGALLYLDGANLNAILGIARPGDFGVDVMHFNTHKTFATPHGGGGPGAGPVGVADHLRPFLPVPQVVRRDDGTFAWDEDRPKSIGKVRSFYGQIGVLVRAYTYVRALGGDGLLDVARKAVLNANYLAARIKGRYELPFPPPYAHEFVALPHFDEQDISNVDVAKRLLDFGMHPPTMSFPIAHCLMIEPTETESLASLDAFADALIAIADEAKDHPERIREAPHTTPIRRMDEVGANRKLNVRWRPE